MNDTFNKLYSLILDDFEYIVGIEQYDNAFYITTNTNNPLALPKKALGFIFSPSKSDCIGFIDE